MQDAIQALLDDPAIDEPAPASTLAVRLPEGGTNRVTDILRLLDGRPTLENASPYEVLVDMERERRQLHHALQMLKVARQRLHEQYIENRREQERTLEGLRRKWEARESKLAMQIARAAMQKARDELAEDRAKLEAEFERRELEWQRERREAEQEWDDKLTLQRAELEAARRQVEDSMRHRRAELRREEAAAGSTDFDGRRKQLQQQLAEARHKAVQAELALVEERARHTAERRAWNDERAKAEAIIRDLVAELEARGGAAQAA